MLTLALHRLAEAFVLTVLLFAIVGVVAWGVGCCSAPPPAGGDARPERLAPDPSRAPERYPLAPSAPLRAFA